jgi:DNA-binding transcriptional MocR family regulator
VAETRRGAGTSLTPSQPAIAGGQRTNALFASLLERHSAAVDLTCAAPSCPPRVAEVLARPADVLPEPLAAQLSHGIGHHPAGAAPLRQAVAEHLSALGLPTDPDQILIASGAQQAIDLLARTYLTPGDAVAAEQVTYPGIIDAIGRAGGRRLGLPLGDHGVDVEAVAHTLSVHRPRAALPDPDLPEPDRAAARRSCPPVLVDLARRHPHTTFVDDWVLGGLDTDHRRCRRWPGSRPTWPTCSPSGHCPSCTGGGCGWAGSGRQRRSSSGWRPPRPLPTSAPTPPARSWPPT